MQGLFGPALGISCSSTKISTASIIIVIASAAASAVSIGVVWVLVFVAQGSRSLADSIDQLILLLTWILRAIIILSRYSFRRLIKVTVSIIIGPTLLLETLAPVPITTLATVPSEASPILLALLI